MKNDKGYWPAISYVSAFLIGVILFWSFGKNWLDLESTSVFLAGLIGVAGAIFLFAAWNTIHHPSHKDH
jgi:protein-S-isoprenylcysteine O-methyltransferase Ste14